MVLPRQSASLCFVDFEVLARQELAQIHRLALEVRQLDADGVAALHHGDAGRHRAHRAGDVVGERDHPRGFRARRRLELVEGDDRAGADVDDLAADAEILERRFEQRRVLLERVLGHRRDRRLLRLGQHLQRRQLVAFAVEERGLGVARQALAGLRSGRRRRHSARRLRPGALLARPIVVRRRPPRAARRCRVENRLAPKRCAAGRGEGRLATGVRGLDPSPQRRLQAHEAVRERPERDDAPAGLLLARRVVVVDAAAGRLVALGRHLRALVGDAEAAGGRDGENRDAREGEADQCRAGAARDAEHGLRRAEKRVADDPAEPGRQGPAAGRRERARDRRRGPRAADPQRQPQVQAADLARAHELPAPDRDRGQEQHRCEPEELHREVGDDRARQAEEVAHRGVGGVVEARILDRPGRERRRDDARKADQAKPAKLGRPALEEGPEGLGEILVGRGTAGRAHRTRDRVGDGPRP